MPRLPRVPRAADPDTDENAPPPSPGSYGFPLLLVLIICAAYLWYRRKQRVSGKEFSLRHLTNRAAPAPIRLSTDDLPPTHEFLSNNASTDSLPAGVELPTVVPQHPAHQSQSTSPIPSFTPSSAMPPRGRRSNRIRDPVEGGDDDGDGDRDSEVESEGHGTGGGEARAGDMFGIGDDEGSPVRK